ncbi:hypothetical protein [Parabacteroides sp. Marseille-P3160]|uniref:hypothetical protein n=1 Tax=Parabacteroides sp. Marseille-P3160 TaxID=1917887 RepID=UPI0009BB20D0|nr:hypothetical protein [Parabacteroides sp. Marseille-P3160]
MKRFYKLFLFSILTVTITGCSNKDNELPFGGSGDFKFKEYTQTVVSKDTTISFLNETKDKFWFVSNYRVVIGSDTIYKYVEYEDSTRIQKAPIDEGWFKLIKEDNNQLDIHLLKNDSGQERQILITIVAPNTRQEGADLVVIQKD